MADYRDSLLLARALEGRLITAEQATEVLIAVRDDPGKSVASVLSAKGYLTDDQTRALVSVEGEGTAASPTPPPADDLEKTIAIERPDALGPSASAVDMERTVAMRLESIPNRQPATEAPPPPSRSSTPDDRTIVLPSTAGLSAAADSGADETLPASSGPAADEKTITLQLARDALASSDALGERTINLSAAGRDEERSELLEAKAGTRTELSEDLERTLQLSESAPDLAGATGLPKTSLENATASADRKSCAEPRVTAIQHSDEPTMATAEQARTQVLAGPSASPPTDGATAAWSEHDAERTAVVGPQDTDRTEVSVPQAHAEVSLPVRPAITREISSVPQLRGQKRYLLEKELARGGLGKVWLSQDRHIARQVAIKELLPAALRSPAMVDRFFEEAQVTGQLEHPGIVPIYELGLKPDGSPFYAMKLLTGRTLSEAIKEYHALPPDDPARPLKFAELLKVFVDVCNAMAYAHSRQVIHRDLKPVNVMLGEYGEAIVVDWGLAKSIGQRDIAPTAEAPEELKSTTMLSSVVRTTWRGEESKTMVGSILGTPAYMPPEQAMGQLDKLDVRSDVYSLGAILYEILVGRPPYRGKSGFELVNMVISGRFDPPRTVNPNVPPELNAICLKAMTYVKEERYPSAKFLAEDVKRWQADEPVSVYPERWQKRVRRWVKRHRTICVSTAASLLAVVILAGLWKWADLRDSAWRGDEGARALRNANDAVGRGDLAEATQVLARAMAITEKPGLAGLYRQIKDLHDDVQAKLKSQQARDNAQKTFDRFEQLRFDAVLNGTLMSGTDEATQLETALELAQQALELYGVSIESGSLPPFDNPYLNPVEIDKIREGCYELLLICANAIANPQPNQSASQMSENAGRALALLELAEKLALPTKVSHLQRAMYLAQQGKQAESDAAAKLFDATPSKKSLDFFLVGLTHYNQRRYDDAIENFEEALALDPEHFWAQYFAALSFLHLDRPAEAIAHLNACRSLKTNFPWLYVIRGFVTGMRAQQLEKAGARSQLVGEAFQDADNDFATALQYEGDHVYAAYVNRGMLRLERGQLDQAAQDLTKAVDQNPNAYRAYTGLAQVYWRQGKTTQAFAEIERALEKARGASWPLRLRGQFHFEQKNYREALRDLDAAVLRSELGGRQASAQDYALRGEVQLVALANESNPAAKKIGHQRARSDFDRALAIDPDYRPARRLRARVLQELGELEAAYQELERYMTNHPNPTGSDYAERAVYRLLRDDSAGAIADITRALQLGVSTDRADRPLLIRRAWAMLNDGAQIAQDDFDAMLAKAKPDDPYAADWYLGRAYARVLLGRTTEATKDVERALPLIQKSNQPRERITWSFNAACVYAQAVARTAFPADDPARQAEALRYHTEALRLLRQAVSFVAPEARAAYVAQVFKDPALDPIRHSKEFKQLVAEFSAAAR